MPEKLYEGKAKILYTTDEPEVLLSVFKDDATAFNAKKRGQIVGKGEVNCTITAALLQYLETHHIPTHYLSTVDSTSMRVRSVTIIPLEVVVRNIVAGSLARETGLPVGQPIPEPLVEFYYKNDDLGDPLLTGDRLRLLELATPEQVTALQQYALSINQHLMTFFDRCDIVLVDFKLEFGVDAHGHLRLADEISPDTCRLWDKAEPDPQKRILDKDRFRHDLGQVEGAYQTMRSRVLQAVTSLSEA
jgi:phosphoribosylaminoimidazole-succinocarboxamide synthase